MKPRDRIDFLVIGAQKAGTTVLYEYLRRHPKLSLPNTKELHFFDNDANYSARLDYYAYRKHFPRRVRGQLLGEVTPSYIYVETAIPRIWQYNRDIKLIALLRNPIERAFSQFAMKRRRGREEKDFRYCIEHERQLMHKSLPRYRTYSYVDRGFYSEQIRRISRHFGDDQILFLKYETFRESNRNVLEQIFEFLGVQSEDVPFEELSAGRRNTEGRIPLSDWQYLFNLYQFDICETERLLGWDCSDWKEY
jgi:hypothetical protein